MGEWYSRFFMFAFMLVYVCRCVCFVFMLSGNILWGVNTKLADTIWFGPGTEMESLAWKQSSFIRSHQMWLWINKMNSFVFFFKNMRAYRRLFALLMSGLIDPIWVAFSSIAVEPIPWLSTRQKGWDAPVLAAFFIQHLPGKSLKFRNEVHNQTSCK